MPSPKDNTKMTGDTHLPEIESNQPVEEGSPIGLGTRGMQSGLVGNTVKKAGVITDGEEDAGADDQSEDRLGTGNETGA
ncbi:hypothetical protein [Polaromonas sp. CG_9.11]|uniref:hypothetical protein n=1 Tax=Polaromonas sp. CG_9.11 TaxID=2787730 RepID=UPI0018CBBC1E|nr:hypothetical protein [Polaromonas sp. CG_9.11]MBG6075808.1 hypothetical protein [Polaromonas sp. CG_9.11]